MVFYKLQQHLEQRKHKLFSLLSFLLFCPIGHSFCFLQYEKEAPEKYKKIVGHGAALALTLQQENRKHTKKKGDVNFNEIS